MVKLSPEKLQKELMENMHEGDYTADELFVVYQSIINFSFNLKFEAVSRVTFRDNLTRWSNVEGSWLVITGRGKGIRYHKWQCHCSHLTRHQLFLSAKRLYEGLKPW